MTQIAVTLISSIALVLAAWIGSNKVGGHVKEIRRQITPSTGKTMAAELAEHRRELAALATAIGVHDRDELRHRPAARNIK